MISILNEDLPIGIYRTLDDIEHLRIRICIKKSDSVSVQEVSNSSIRPHEFELMQLRSEEEKFCAEYIFSWQEKVAKNENSEGSIEESRNRIPLFSYISTELSSWNFKDKMWLTIRCLKTENNISLSGKTTFTSDGIKTFQKPCFLKELVHMSSRKIPSYTTGQSMTLMTLLDSSDSLEAEEVQLCFLTYDRGVLTVIPNFSHTPYYIQSSKSENYEFIIENVSNPMRSSDADLEKAFLKKVHEHHAATISSIVGSEFEIARNKTKVFYILGELLSAENFDANNLFIRFTLQLPKGALPSEENSLQGFTNFCRVKKKPGEIGTVAHFGLPLNLKFEADDAEDLKDVRLLLEVSSLDFWNVCRNEGYGSCTIPTIPGCQTFKVKTWKLLPQSILERLRHFFIGQTPYLCDLNYVHIPLLLQDSHLSKYGVRTEASGSVSIKLNVIMQISSQNSRTSV